MHSAFYAWLTSPQTSLVFIVLLLEPFLEPQMYMNSVFLIFLLVSLFENIETKEDERDIIVEIPIFAWIFIGICSVFGICLIMFHGGAWLGILDVPIFRHILNMIALILISISISFGIICLVFFVYVQLSHMFGITFTLQNVTLMSYCYFEKNVTLANPGP